MSIPLLPKHFRVLFGGYHVQLFCNLMDYSPPGSSVHGISQVRILELLATSFFQEIFPIQESSLHWLVNSLPLSHQGRLWGHKYIHRRRKLDLLVCPPAFASCYSIYRAFQVALVVKNLPASTREERDAGSIPWSGKFPGGVHAIHSSILTWRIPWREEPVGLHGVFVHGSQRVRHYWHDLAQHNT